MGWFSKNAVRRTWFVAYQSTTGDTQKMWGVLIRIHENGSRSLVDLSTSNLRLDNLTSGWRESLMWIKGGRFPSNAVELDRDGNPMSVTQTNKIDVVLRTYRQACIMRSDLLNNRDVYYLFGDNNERVGLGGQAKEMRGEPNAIGVRTKMTPTSGSNAFFSDDEYDQNCKMILADMIAAFDKRDKGHMIVIPTDGLGTGLSELPERAPRTNEYVELLISRLMSGEKAIG